MYESTKEVLRAELEDVIREYERRNVNPDYDSLNLTLTVYQGDTRTTLDSEIVWKDFTNDRYVKAEKLSEVCRPDQTFLMEFF